ncbi:MFS general substrate transporter [Punctularia strigosozonata HHB-11173 SS5]|uniref:MFS general substrate transporter n=1 Tax=Punctularia strigosozonata (strain HHB-11173) TaxID=741275 RepID=R7S5S9_PUNST|nr:MFS general substrate transporter [Punctularia strigosozonata HHB-11173 SS5]EIN04996.1 MFS general substrate transporter [Punctularia strigosozonata HHB-11173 SS5]
MTDSVARSPPASLLDGNLQDEISGTRRYALLAVFCLAQFLDSFNNSSLFSALPTLIVQLHMSESESTWLISAYQLTFASFLLVSGRIADVYNPKVSFIMGISCVGFICIGAGFLRSKIVLIVLRALCGIAACLTIPSALTLLVNIFIEPTEQARAIGIFGGCGAVGNVLGLIIGAIFVQFTSWPWVFWFAAIVALPLAGMCVFLIPKQEPRPGEEALSRSVKFKTIDSIGVSVLTAALILLIFGVTSGTSSGWGSATVLAPLIISVFLVTGFLYYETRIPSERAAVPPSIWFYKNFSVLFGVALLPHFWFTAVFTIYTNLFQAVFDWSAIVSAIHFLPVGIVASVVSCTGPLARIIEPKWIILTGEALLIVATILLALASSPNAYWPFVFPAFVVGATGAMLAFTHTNIAIFRTTPSRMAGTVGAIYNGALQLGSAVGIATVSSVESSVEKKSSRGFDGYEGRAAALWFMLGVVGMETISVLAFYRVGREVADEEEVSQMGNNTELRSSQVNADLKPGDTGQVEKRAAQSGDVTERDCNGG